MKQNKNAPGATIAALQPSSGGEAAFRALKNAVRLHGSHLMAMRRPSKTPEASRKYVHGDPVSMIDWRAFARTDQLIIRERRDEASARVAIGVDLGETMRWPPTPRQVPSKWELAARLALHIAYAHLRMGDTVSIHAFGIATEGEHHWRPRSSAEVVDLFTRLSRTDFDDSEAFVAGFTQQTGEARSCDVAFFVSDCLGEAASELFFQQAKRRILLHVLSSLEDDVSWIEAQTCYFDEGRGRKEYQGEVLLKQDGYQKALTRWRGKLSRRAEEQAGDYCYLTDATPLSTYLALLEDLGKGPRLGRPG